MGVYLVLALMDSFLVFCLFQDVHDEHKYTEQIQL